MSQAVLDKERIEYQREYGAEDGDALFSQEYMCDWEAAIVGSYYGKMMRDFTYIDVTAIDKERGCIGEPTILSASEAPSRARKIIQKGEWICISAIRN